ncbi:MAG TPA: hypothetical protein VL171_06500 [Verrucomicrobiae bacterium]|nr:hypothetical protein [Verrucomicrobiae bacterium]
MEETPTFDQQRLRRIAPDVLAVAVLALFLTFFYWDFLTGRGFIWDDTMTEFYPGVNYFAKSIKASRFPLWIPGVHDGMPFYSDPEMAVYYPPQWLLIPFVQNGRLPFLVYQRYIVLHYLFAGLCMYAFLKQLKLDPMAALGGALVFCFSGFASLMVVSFVKIQVYAWLPLQLLLVHRLTSSGSRWAWLGLLSAMLMSLVAGFPQTTLYGWYLVIAYWLYLSLRHHHKDDRSWKVALCRLAHVELPRQLAAYALVFGIAAIMVLPTIQNWWLSGRPKLPFQEIADPSLPYHELLTLFVPNFFGTTTTADVTPPVTFWGFDPQSPNVRRLHPVNAGPGYWQYWEFGAYVGQIFWLALLLILFNWKRVTDKGTVGFFTVAWFGAMWFALGRYGGLFNLAYYLVPGAALFRGAARMTSVAALAAGMLTAYAINLLLQRRGTRLRTWPLFLPAAAYGCLVLALFVGGEHLAVGLHDTKRLLWARHETLYALGVIIICALTMTGTAWIERSRMQVTCLGAAIVISFVDFQHAYGSFHSGRVSPDEYYPKSNRLLVLLKEYREKRGPFRFGQIIRGKIGEEIATFRNLPYFHDFLEVPEGYTGFYVDSVAQFQGITNEEAKIAIQNIRVTMERDAQGRDWLGTRTNSFPRARFFSRVRYFDSPDELRHALAQDEFDWRNEVAVCEMPGFDVGNEDEHGQQASTNDSIQFESLTPESNLITYNVSRPGVIFISQTFYPGWGVSPHHQLIETFGAFQGIVIPQAGTGQIHLRFSPQVLKWGIAITLFSMIVVILLAFQPARALMGMQIGRTETSTPNRSSADLSGG